VLKLTLISDPGYNQYVKSIRSHLNKYFPKISDLKTLTVAGEDFGIYLIEKLAKIREPLDEIYAEIFRSMMEVGTGAITIQNTPAPQEYSQRQWENILDKVLSNKELMTAMQLVVSWSKKSKFKIDMHRGNIMQRKDGTIVITDPYV
jgi:hypothetical protein